MRTHPCDLCGRIRECLEIQIDGKEYDVCAECWLVLTELKGKGRPVRERDMIFLPPPAAPAEEEPEKPFPGQPPKIWFAYTPN